MGNHFQHQDESTRGLLDRPNRLKAEFDEKAFHDACAISMSGQERMPGTIKTAAAMAAINQVHDIEQERRKKDDNWLRIWLSQRLGELQDSLAQTEANMDAMIDTHMSETERDYLAQFEDDKDRYYSEADKLMQAKLANGDISQDDYDRWFAAMSEREGFKAAIAQVEHDVAVAQGTAAKTTVAHRHDAETLEASADKAKNDVDRDVMEGVALDKVDAGNSSGQAQWSGLNAKLSG